jgi:hypothetical protein
VGERQTLVVPLAYPEPPLADDLVAVAPLAADRHRDSHRGEPRPVHPDGRERPGAVSRGARASAGRSASTRAAGAGSASRSRSRSRGRRSARCGRPHASPAAASLAAVALLGPLASGVVEYRSLKRCGTRRSVSTRRAGGRRHRRNRQLHARPRCDDGGSRRNTSSSARSRPTSGTAASRSPPRSAGTCRPQARRYGRGRHSARTDAHADPRREPARPAEAEGCVSALTRRRGDRA